MMTSFYRPSGKRHKLLVERVLSLRIVRDGIPVAAAKPHPDESLIESPARAVTLSSRGGDRSLLEPEARTSLWLICLGVQYYSGQAFRPEKAHQRG